MKDNANWCEKGSALSAGGGGGQGCPIRRFRTLAPGGALIPIFSSLNTGRALMQQ